MHSPTQLSSRRRGPGFTTLGVGIAALLLSTAVLSVAWVKRSPAPQLTHATFPALPPFTSLEPAPALEELTDELRRKGFSECNPHDPIGLGPYSPYDRVSLGKILIPQKGGHTKDMGYDVLVHFHGGDAVRKVLVQVTRGLVLVLVDMGTGGGPYSRAFGAPSAYPTLRRSIESALRRHCGDGRAHIRRLALSSWSAGYVAINKIVQQKHDGYDAVVILDGLHAGYNPAKPKVPDIRNLEVAFLDSALELARRAQRREIKLVITHSEVDPVKYPSTRLTADLLLDRLGLSRKKLDPGSDKLAQTSSVEAGDFQLWGFGGREEMAHCNQLRHIGRIATEVLEPAWDTPEMDRSVAPTPWPAWKKKR